MIKSIEFTGLDYFFFRDTKSLIKGSDFKAKSIFPPASSVVRGAMRTAYFSENMDEFEMAGEQGDPSDKIKIICTMIKYQNNILIPVPKNMYVDIINKKRIIKKLKLKVAPLYSSFLMPYCLSIQNVVGTLDEVQEDDYIELESLVKLLNNQIDQIESVQLSELITREMKTGIGINSNTGVTQEHMYYQTEIIYPFDKEQNPISIIALTEGLDLIANQGVVKLGGEGKGATYKISDLKYIDFIMKAPKISKYFAITLLSQSIFKHGWLPGFLDPDTYEGDISGLKVRLLSASVGRRIAISGFDMKRRRPKPLYYGVPAGSVYYFEILEGNQKMILETFHLRNISDEQREEGLGFSFVHNVELN